MHVAGGRAKCTKRKEARYELRHRHLADRFDGPVTSSAGQCSYPQSEVFVKHWNSENVTGISFAEHLERSHLCRSVFERKKCSATLPSFTSSMNIRFWGASLCCRRLQCGHRAADLQLGWRMIWRDWSTEVLGGGAAVTACSPNNLQKVASSAQELEGCSSDSGPVSPWCWHTTCEAWLLFPSCSATLFSCLWMGFVQRDHFITGTRLSRSCWRAFCKVTLHFLPSSKVAVGGLFCEYDSAWGFGFSF